MEVHLPGAQNSDGVDWDGIEWRICSNGESEYAAANKAGASGPEGEAERAAASATNTQQLFSATKCKQHK